MAKLGSFVRALVLTVGLWGLYYWLDTIHDGSLGAIAEFVKVLASLCSIVVAAALFVGAMALLRPRGKTRARRASSSAGMLPHAAAPSIAMANTELDPARQPVVRLGPLASGGAALAFFAYFPVARYFQILTPIRFWVVVMALSAVGAILVHVLYIRRRLLQFAKRSDRLGTAVMPAIFIIPCLAIVLRLLNAPADLFVPHQTQTAVVTHTSVWVVGIRGRVVSQT